MAGLQAPCTANEVPNSLGQYHSVEFSLKGLEFPYKFRIRKIGSKPTCFVVRKNSDILPLLKVGDVLNTRYFAKGCASPPVERKTVIRDVTENGYARARDHYLVSLKILDDEPKASRQWFLRELNREAWMEEGRKRYRSGHYREAVAAFSHAIELSPHHPLGYFNRAIGWSRLRDHHRVLNDLRSAARLGFKKAQEYLDARHVPWLPNP